MKRALISLAVLALAAPAAFAQSEGDVALVMYVAPGPDYRFSVGVGEQNGDQIRISERLEMGSGCTWARAGELSVPADDVVPVGDPHETDPERFGVIHAMTYSALVSHRGGTPAVEDHRCVRVAMTGLARGATQQH